MAESSTVRVRSHWLAGRRLSTVLTWLLVGAALLPLCWQSVTTVAALLRFPYATDGLEATLLSQAHLLWSGQPLYQPFERYSFVSAPYPPWHPLALGFADLFAGIHPFWSGRMVSLLAALGVLGVVCAVVRGLGRSWLPAIVATALLLGAPPFMLWASRIKPDMYALLWTTLGLGASVVAAQVGSSRRRMLAAVLAALGFALAFFTKQTALAGPLAAGVALLYSAWRERRRDAFAPVVAFALAYAALLGITWLLLDGWSAGQFTFHIWTQHRQAEWSLALMLKYAALLGEFWPLLLLALGVLPLAVRGGPLAVLAAYVLLAPLTLYGAGKTGANHNHLLETLLAATLAGGVVLAWALRRLSSMPLRASVALALVVLQAALLYIPNGWYGSELAPSETPERYLEFIGSTPGEVLADDPSLLYLAGKPMRYDDPSGFGPVAYSGLWDDSGLVEDIRARRFSAILIPPDVTDELSDSTGRWTPAMLAAIRDNYTVLFRDTQTVYVPNTGD